MKNIITAIIAIACIVAGGVGGHFLRSMSGGSGGDSHAEKPADDGHGKKDDGHGEKKDDQAAKKDDHGAKKDDHGKKPGKKDAHGKDTGASSDVVYYKFSREFVVPIIRESRVHSLVILNLNLEVDADLSQKLFEMEPKIRDNIMTTLVTLSNDGSTLQSITTVENYESLRSVLLQNLQVILPSGLQNVLIVDFAKQDV